MVEDARDRYPPKPAPVTRPGVGAGRGREPTRNLSQGFEQACQGCHLSAEDPDRVFVDGYPTLHP
jgi:hypothetical protein